LSRLKGELEAVERMSIQKKCNLEFRHEPMPPPKPRA
jgi:hypothetical protein